MIRTEINNVENKNTIEKNREQKNNVKNQQN